MLHACHHSKNCNCCTRAGLHSLCLSPLLFLMLQQQSTAFCIFFPNRAILKELLFPYRHCSLQFINGPLGCLQMHIIHADTTQQGSTTHGKLKKARAGNWVIPNSFAHAGVEALRGCLYTGPCCRLAMVLQDGQAWQAQEPFWSDQTRLLLNLPCQHAQDRPCLRVLLVGMGEVCCGKRHRGQP